MGFLDPVQSFADTALDATTATAKVVAEDVEAAAGEVTEEAGGFAGTVQSGVGGLFGSLPAPPDLDQVQKEAGEEAGDAFSALSGGFSSVFEDVEAAATSAGEELEETAQEVADETGTLVDAAGGVIGHGLGSDGGGGDPRPSSSPATASFGDAFLGGDGPSGQGPEDGESGGEPGSMSESGGRARSDATAVAVVLGAGLLAALALEGGG